MKQGWTYKTLRDIADIKGGKRVPKGYKLQTTETNHPYIRVADFNDFGTVDMSDIQYISEDIFEQIKNYTITDKDLYVSIAGTIGKTGIIPSLLNGANLTENACKLVFKEDINLRFVYLFTLSEIFKKQVVKATKQASQPKLALTRLAEIKISIPPLCEQERIVKRLDAAFAQIDELKSNAERQLAEARALFQSALKEMLAPKEGWVEKKMSELYDVRDGTHDSPKYHETGYPLVTSKNLRGGILDMSNVSLISEEDYKAINIRSKVDIGDVLFAMIGTIGNPVYVQTEPNYAIKNMALFKVPPTQSGEFLRYYLLNNNVLLKMQNESKGTTQKFVSLGYLRNFLVRIPNLSEQKQLVSRLDSLKSKVDCLQENFTKISQECDAMKQALLRQIFE